MNVAGLELQCFIAQDFGLGKHIEVEGSRDVARLLVVPLKCANANLESVHPRAVVLQFLIAIFNLVETVGCVLLVHAKA